jgi:wyosine [tRNA(Phe)-imidazoG37] synthetase (radical SAM superfamily)
MRIMPADIVGTNLEQRRRKGPPDGADGAQPEMKPAILSEHSRQFQHLRFAYPVVSRRSRGLSLGLNVNPDKACNFDCPYCQVDRTVPGRDREVDFDAMIDEIDELMGMAVSGEIWTHPRFEKTPQSLRRFNDIALAGDGEPTTYPRLKDAIDSVHALRARHGLADVKIIVLTNALLLHKPEVLDALLALRQGPYEIWAKLDGGTQPYFELMAGRKVNLQRVVDNIALCAQQLEVTIQSLFPTLDGKDPGEEEMGAVADCVNEIASRGGRVRLIQVYTTARKPSDPRIGMIEDARLDQLADVIRSRVTVPVEVYYGLGTVPGAAVGAEGLSP